MKEVDFLNRHDQLSGRNLGKIEGYQAGWNAGFRIGRAQQVYKNHMNNNIKKHPQRVLYVTSGIGVPYPLLDESIIDALQNLVSKLIVASPADPIEQVAEQHSVDLMLALNGVVLPLDQVDAVRQKGIKTAIWFTDDPYYTDWTIEIAPHYDYIFTLEINCVSLYRKIGCKHVYYLPFAMNPKIFYPQYVEYPSQLDVAFVGTAYWNRVKAIDKMATFLKKKSFLISGWWWDRLQNYSSLKPFIQLDEWMSGEQTALCYNRARMIINMHRESDDVTINHNGLKLPADSINPRTFEISGCHTLQLIDHRSELSQFYIPDKEVVVYHSVQELEELIEYYLNHTEEMQEIAYRGFKRTIRDHTYIHRLEALLNHIFNEYAQG